MVYNQAYTFKILQMTATIDYCFWVQIQIDDCTLLTNTGRPWYFWVLQQPPSEAYRLLYTKLSVQRFFVIVLYDR